MKGVALGGGGAILIKAHNSDGCVNRGCLGLDLLPSSIDRAMASPDALEGLSACECPVCFNILSEETNVPMSMPCGHTLCSTCIDRLVSKATSTAGQLGVRRVPTFQCPLCREWINREAVHLNITLRDLLGESVLVYMTMIRGISLAISDIAS